MKFTVDGSSLNHEEESIGILAQNVKGLPRHQLQCRLIWKLAHGFLSGGDARFCTHSVIPARHICAMEKPQQFLGAA